MQELMTVRATTIHGEKIDIDLAPYEETDDPNARAHFVRGEENPHLWEEGMTGQDIVDLARFSRQKVKALCGFEWIPLHNPDNHDICQPCQRIWEALA